MSSTAHPPAAAAVAAEHPVAVAGRLLVRFGLVVVIAWIGALKYTSYEAVAIQPLVAHSALLSWVYHIFSVRTFAAALGTAEIIAALLIALRPLAPRISVPGASLWTLGDSLGAARSHARSAIRTHHAKSRRIDVSPLAASRPGGS